MLDRTKRSLYDKWRSSGLTIPFKQWESMKAGMSATLHWAVPRQERMLPEGKETAVNEHASSPVDSRSSRSPDNSASTTQATASSAAEKGKLLTRQDSNHPTLVMVNKWSEEDVRKKFRNYEI